MIEEWRTILEFPNYDVSNYGQIYNTKVDQPMRISFSNYGHTKITLTDFNGDRHTRSVAQLVADAFVEPIDMTYDHLIVLDGDFSNIVSNNLAWRPRWFAWRYTRQLKKTPPLHYRNLPVINVTQNIEYDSIIDAGITEGLLFVDIWRSTYTGDKIFPYGDSFEVVKRV